MPPGAADRPPLATTEKQRGALRIVQLDEQAQALGLTPGMSLADARARAPELEAVDHDPHNDEQLLEQLADRCDRYTPMVAIDLPDGLILDISGCAHLFGDEGAMLADVERLLQRYRLRWRHAFASTPEAARALARFSRAPAADERSAVCRLPVAALGLPPEQEQALVRAGLKSIGDLARRPTAPLSARFGKAATFALERLLGRSDSRITPRRVEPMLILEHRFAEPVGRMDDVLAATGQMLADAASRLEEVHKGGRSFHLRLYRSDGERRDLSVETGRPVRDPAIILRLLQDRIDALADPIDPGFGFDLIRMAVPVIEAMGGEQLALEGGRVSDEEVTALLDRLSARHGRRRFRRFVARDSHVPEQAALALPGTKSPPVQAWPVTEEKGPPRRPVHLFDPPQPVTVIAEVPDGPPQCFRWQRVLYEVARYEGPERIAAPWWEQEGNGLTRDYYRVEDRRGRRFWLFRHGLYGSERPDPGWYIHGLFA